MSSQNPYRGTDGLPIKGKLAEYIKWEEEKQKEKLELLPEDEKNGEKKAEKRLEKRMGI